MDNIQDLSVEEIAAALDERRTALSALLELADHTDEQAVEAESLAAEVRELAAEQSTREEAVAARAARMESLRSEFAPADEDEDVVEDGDEEFAEEEAPASDEDSVTASAPTQGVVKTLARRSTRPKAPAASDNGRITITAAADVPNYALGQSLNDISTVAAATIERASALPPFSASRQVQSDTPVLQKFGVASFALPFPEEMRVKRGNDHQKVIEHARKETRLQGGSLTAAGGWCAPSETIYDLCDGETLEGLISLPEISIDRGGINFTSGPDFATLYNDIGFCQTEAEAIAGTPKDCYEVVCPPFEEVRLGACGICITVPILTEAAYPELVERVISGALIAHQHRMSANVIAKMVAAAGAARVFTGLGASVTDSLEALELVAMQRRQAHRLGIHSTLEVVMPFWLEGVFRADLSRRNGEERPATDEQLRAYFAARHLNVQFVYNWQPLDGTAEVYPATFQALIYPAGTFVKGVKDVINLSAVYDQASLSVNTYTGVFFEQGYLVAQTCYGADLVQVPICNAGRQGALDLTCAVTP